MSPSRFTRYVANYALSASGAFNGGAGVNGDYNVRPAISLSKDVKVSGTGTDTDPYVVIGM